MAIIFEQRNKRSFLVKLCYHGQYFGMKLNSNVSFLAEKIEKNISHSYLYFMRIYCKKRRRSCLVGSAILWVYLWKLHKK